MTENYNAVQPRQTLAHSSTRALKAMKKSSNVNISNSESKEKKDMKDPSKWPKPLHDFISSSFAKANELKLAADEKKMFQGEMKKLINMAINQGKIETNNWSKQQLPSLLKDNQAKLQLYCDTISSNLPVFEPQSRFSNKSVSRKRNIFGESDSESEDNDNNTNNNIFVDIHKRNNSLISNLKKMKKSKKKVVVPSTLPPVPLSTGLLRKQNLPHISTADRMALRGKRFERELNVSVDSIAQSYEDSLSTEPLVGTCQILEKRYLRLTSQPNPETVRPLPVLRKTLQLLLDKYIEGATYNYLCDQCKSLRQDLTVQNIKTNFTIMVYEFHSKLAIEFGDLGEFNQCQSQLKILYEDVTLEKYNLNQFYSYRILYFAITNNFNEAFELKLKLINNGINIDSDCFLTDAFSITEYLMNDNYYSLSMVYKRIKELGQDAKIVQNSVSKLNINNDKSLLLNHKEYYFFYKFLMMIIDREAVKTLAILCKSYRQIAIPFLKQMLSIENDMEFKQFLKEKKLQQYFNEESMVFDSVRARDHVESLKNQVFRKIDIKGQI